MEIGLVLEFIGGEPHIRVSGELSLPFGDVPISVPVPLNDKQVQEWARALSGHAGTRATETE